MASPDQISIDIGDAIEVIKRSRHPSNEDLESLFEFLSRKSWSQFFPFANVTEAADFFGQVHAAESQNKKIEAITLGLELMALAKYRKAHLTNLADWERMSSQEAITRLVREERYNRLERYLNDLATVGYKKASSRLRKPDPGIKFQYVNAAFFSILEIIVALRVFNLCEPGFQVLVVSLLGLVYARMTSGLVRVARADGNRFIVVVSHLARIRTRLNDDLLELDAINEEQDEVEKLLHRDTIECYIIYTKCYVIELIAVVEILRTVF